MFVLQPLLPVLFYVDQLLDQCLLVVVLKNLNFKVLHSLLVLRLKVFEVTRIQIKSIVTHRHIGKALLITGWDQRQLGSFLMRLSLRVVSVTLTFSI